MLDLTQELPLKRAWSYPRATRPSQTLPLVHGDMTQGGAGGLWGAVCLDAEAGVWALAGHELASEAAGNTITLYDGDGNELDPAGYTLNLAHNYLSNGVIATAIFGGDESPSAVTVRAQGKPGADGASLTNPLDIVRDLVLSLPGAEAADLDQGGFARARARAGALGFTAAGVVTRPVTGAKALTGLLSEFLGSWWLTGQGRLKVVLDLGPGSLEESELACALREANLRDVAAQAELGDVVNRAEVLYCLNHASGEYEAGLDGLAQQDLRSQGLYGLRAATLERAWVRTEAAARAISARAVNLLGRPRRVITCTDTALTNLPLEKGDAALLSLGWLRDRLGRPLVNQIVRVLSMEPELDQGGIAFTLLDTGYCKTLAWPADGAWLADGSRLAGGERDETEY